MPDIKNYKNLEDIRQGFKTKLLSEPESLLSCKRQRCLRLIMRNGNVWSSQVWSMRNVAMAGHWSAVRCPKRSLRSENRGRPTPLCPEDKSLCRFLCRVLWAFSLKDKVSEPGYLCELCEYRLSG